MVGVVAVPLDLGAEAGGGGIGGAALHVGRVAPHVGEQLLTGDRGTRSGHQVGQELGLACGQLHRVAVADHHAAIQVHRAGGQLQRARRHRAD